MKKTTKVTKTTTKDPVPKKTNKTSVTVKGPVTNASRRAPLMETNMRGGNKMYTDTTSMNKPDAKTYSYMIKKSDGSVVRKGNLSDGVGKNAAKNMVSQMKNKK